jgi:hypothetical protein
MDTGRGMMLGFGILIVYLAWKVVREGEKWGLNAVFLSGLLSGVYSWAPTILYFIQGLYNGVSGVSLGIWTSILLFAPWVLGLTFGWIGVMRQERFPTTQASHNNIDQ